VAVIGKSWVVLHPDLRDALLDHAQTLDPVQLYAWIIFEMQIWPATLARGCLGKLIPTRAAQRCVDWYARKVSAG
jgi:hypothetical protein